MIEFFEGFAGPTGFGKHPAIIVVDFIKGFTDPACLLGTDFSEQIRATRTLLDEARNKRLPIIFTTVIYEPHFKDGAHFITKIPALKVLTAESPWIEIDQRLGRGEEEPLVIKKFASAFFGTALHSILIHQQVDTIIIAGSTTSGCVRATAVDALQYGYRVIVPVECVGDRSNSAHLANLYDINTKYGDVVKLSQVLNELSTIF